MYIRMTYRVKLFTKIKTVNDLIVAVRIALKLTQTEFGEKLGYPQKSISRWETGVQMSPELETGIKIGLAAARLKVPYEDILTFGLEPDKPDRAIASEDQTDYNPE